MSSGSAGPAAGPLSFDHASYERRWDRAPAVQSGRDVPGAARSPRWSLPELHLIVDSALGATSGLVEWTGGRPASAEIAALAGLAGLGDDVLAELSASTPRRTSRFGSGCGSRSGCRSRATRAGRATSSDGLLDAAASGSDRGFAWRPARASTTRSRRPACCCSSPGDSATRLPHDVSQYLADGALSESASSRSSSSATCRASLDAASARPGEFAWTVAGERHEVELGTRRRVHPRADGQQRATLALERLKGELAVVTTWTRADAALPTSSHRSGCSGP